MAGRRGHGNAAMSRDIRTLFELKDKVAVITGGGGLLGEMHAEAIADAGGIPVLLDLRGDRVKHVAKILAQRYRTDAQGLEVDITAKHAVTDVAHAVLARFGRIDILINNAANDPKVQSGGEIEWSRFESFSPEQWQQDVSVGLTGAFYCCQVMGSEMARRNSGVIINIASDLGLIAPDQRLYRKPGVPDDRQPVKPVTYSVVKHGIIGLTRYLATYWAERNVRVNALAPGGVRTEQPEEFIRRLSSLIPMGRMASKDEYKAAIVFLASDASSYMTGTTLVIDGGRTCW